MNEKKWQQQKLKKERIVFNGFNLVLRLKVLMRFLENLLVKGWSQIKVLIVMIWPVGLEPYVSKN